MSWEGSNRRSRLPEDWHRRRNRVLRRDDRRCQLRWHGCLGTATEVDHRIRGDDHDESNLQAVCSACHQKKSASEGNDRARELRARRKRPPERHPGMR